MKDSMNLVQNVQKEYAQWKFILRKKAIVIITAQTVPA